MVAFLSQDDDEEVEDDEDEVFVQNTMYDLDDDEGEGGAGGEALTYKDFFKA